MKTSAAASAFLTKPERDSARAMAADAAVREDFRRLSDPRRRPALSTQGYFDFLSSASRIFPPAPRPAPIVGTEFRL